MSLTIDEVFKRASPQIKDSTLKQYRNSINRLLLDTQNIISQEDKEEAFTFKWISDYKNLIPQIENSSRTANTKRTLYGYLKVFIKGLSNDWHSLEEFKEYDKMEAQHRKGVIKTKETNREKTGMPLTDNQVKNLLTIEEIQAVLNTLTEEVKKLDKKEEPLTGEEKENYVLFILLNIHFRLPIRNELHNLYKVNRKMYDKHYLEDKEFNWIIVEPDKTLTLVRNVYKTADSQTSGGRKIDTIPPQLAKMLKKYMKIFKIKYNNPVFPSINNSVDYSRALSNKFEKIYNKKISSTMLMKIINQLSEEEQGVVKILRSLSKKRGTNIGALIDYYL